jgi:hypothetical protein
MKTIATLIATLATTAAFANPNACEVGYPKETVMELQTLLNKAGEKLKVDGKMCAPTRQAHLRHPQITTQPLAAQAVAAEIAKGDMSPTVNVAAK